MRMRLKRYVDAIGVHETSIMQYMEDYGMKYRILDEILLETLFYPNTKKQWQRPEKWSLPLFFNVSNRPQSHPSGTDRRSRVLPGADAV